MKILLLLLFILSAAALAQAFQAPAPAPSPYKPTELQAAKLENLQLRAQMAQQNYFNALGALQGECAKIVAENKWDPKVTCNLLTLEFFLPQPKAEEKAQPEVKEKKPEVKE